MSSEASEVKKGLKEIRGAFLRGLHELRGAFAPTENQEAVDNQAEAEAPRKLPSATLFESRGKLMEAVDENPKDKRARMQARRNSMTYDRDDPFEASGSKEGPGRVSRGRHFSSTYSPSERRSSGASSSSPCEIPIESSTPSFAAQGNDELHAGTWSKEGPERQSRVCHFPSTCFSSSSRGAEPDVLKTGSDLPRREPLPAEEKSNAWDGAEGAGVWSDLAPLRLPDMEGSRGAHGDTAVPASSSCNIDQENTPPLYC